MVRQRFTWVTDVPKVVGMLLRLHWPDGLGQIETPRGLEISVRRCAHILGWPEPPPNPELPPIPQPAPAPPRAPQPDNSPEALEAARTGRTTATGAPPPAEIRCPWLCCSPHDPTARKYARASELWQHIVEQHGLDVPNSVRHSQYGYFAAKAAFAASQMAPPHLAMVAAKAAANAAVNPARIHQATRTAQQANRTAQAATGGAQAAQRLAQRRGGQGGRQAAASASAPSSSAATAAPSSAVPPLSLIHI